MKQKSSQRQQEKPLRRKRRRAGTRAQAPTSRFTEQEALQRMAADMRRKEGFSGLTPVINPPGQEKMSDVMEQFMAPYLSYAQTLVEMQRLAILAAIAWNAAIMSEDGRLDFLDGMIETMPADLREDAGNVIGDLIQRKERYFAENKRIVVNMQVTDTGDGFHLAVASSMPGEKS